MTYLPDSYTEKMRLLNRHRADQNMSKEEFTLRAIRPDLGLCPRCDGYGLTGDDPSGQNLASCTACDESGLIPLDQIEAQQEMTTAIAAMAEPELHYCATSEFSDPAWAKAAEDRLNRIGNGWEDPHSYSLTIEKGRTF